MNVVNILVCTLSKNKCSSKEPYFPTAAMEGSFTGEYLINWKKKGTPLEYN